MQRLVGELFEPVIGLDTGCPARQFNHETFSSSPVWLVNPPIEYNVILASCVAGEIEDAEELASGVLGSC